VYYHCTGERRAACGRPYISEAKITEAFSDLLKRLTVPNEVFGWIQDGLREADRDRHQKRAKREGAIRQEISTIRARLEKLYMDKLDGDVSAEFYRETRSKWESRITELQLELAAIDRAEPTSVDEAMRILELASTAHLRFKNANSEKKRELLQFMLSNSSWVEGKLEVELFEAFDLMLNLAETATQNENETIENGLVNIKSVDWWRIGDSNP
jgi:hypothetical protein